MDERRPSRFSTRTSSESKEFLGKTLPLHVYPRHREKRGFRLDVYSRYHACTGIPLRETPCAGVSRPGRKLHSHQHPRYLPWAAPRPSLTGPDPPAHRLCLQAPAMETFFKSEFLFNLTNPKKDRGQCGSLRSACAPLPPPTLFPLPTSLFGWTPVWLGSPAVCFAQPSLKTPMPRGRPNGRLPDALGHWCLPEPRNGRPFRGQDWGGVGSG